MKKKYPMRRWTVKVERSGEVYVQTIKRKTRQIALSWARVRYPDADNITVTHFEADRSGQPKL